MEHRHLLRIFLTYLIALIVLQANAQLPKYSKVQVQTPGTADVQRLYDMGFDIDHYQGDRLHGIEFFVTRNELQELERSEFEFEILIDDFRKYYTEQRKEDEAARSGSVRSGMIASNFGYGSMGGFYTLQEVEDKLDSMSIKFPDISTQKFSIGTSIEGRDIWAVKISDNPAIDEDEPTVYYDALHHVREPLGMAVTINYMYWLLENYTTDPRVKYIVDNREQYFVPVVNPDGYEYNRQTDPNGGGLWRKNRRDNGAGCFGVDLNRNYSKAFGNTGTCASSNPCFSTYKGTAAFSEPESEAVRAFIDTINPLAAFSTHSTAGKYLMPYGYTTSPPEYEIYSEWASDFLDENDFPYGVTYEMLGYTSCGITRDWMLSEGIYGWTPEIGGSGFWPPQSTIFDLVDENIRPFFYLAWIAGGYADVQNHIITGNAFQGSSLQIEVTVKNKGVGVSSDNVTVELISSDPGVSVSAPVQYGNIVARSLATNTADPFLLTVDNGFAGDSFNIEMVVSQEGVETTRETITIHIGERTVLFSDDAENGLLNWTATGAGKQWGIVQDDTYSGDFSFGDSNGGNSFNNTDNNLTQNDAVKLIPGEMLRVEFMAKWCLEAADNATLEISTDGGGNWVTLKTYTLNNSWIQQSIDLTDYMVYDSLQFRFAMFTNFDTPGDGYYFDDFEVVSYKGGWPISVDGIEDQNVDIKLFPNPSGDKLIVSSPFDISDVRIYNATGKMVSGSQIEGLQNFEIDISDLSSGLYFLTLRSSEHVVTERFVVERK